MKYLKKICCLVLVLGVILSLGITGMATDNSYINYTLYDYYIENYDVNAVLQENNVMVITEDITVNYQRDKQGIIRILPILPEVDKLIDGRYKKMTYKVEIDDITVNDNFKTYKEDNYLMIQIGTEGVYNSGIKQYKLTYTMDMGDDRVEEFDELFYSIIGADWDCPIKNVTFNVQLPKEIDQLEINMYSGRFGNTEGDNIEYSIENNRVVGRTIKPLNSYEGLTIYTLLPEGYFVNEREADANFAILLSGIAFGLFAAIGFCVIKSKGSRNVVKTIEFYPPEGITSAQVGYIMDGHTSQNEVLSLIVWLADKKYIKIEEKTKGQIFLSKTDKPISDLPSHVKPLYNGIFEFGDDIDIKTLNLYESVGAAASLAGQSFNGKRKRLYNNTVRICAAICGMALFVVGGISVYLYGAQVNYQMAICGTVTFVTAFILFLLFQFTADGWRFASPTTKAMLLAVAAVLTAIPVGLTFWLSKEYSFGGQLLPTATAIVTVLGCAMAPFTASYTEYMRNIQGKLLGFRDFISEAEKEKLELLVEESPEYFFNVLPYAYVFGLTDKWIDKFEAIDLSATMIGGNLDPMTMLYATRAVTRIRSNIAAPINTSSLSSGKSYGNSYSGGGFSGGGFGGGGGRSW